MQVFLCFRRRAALIMALFLAVPGVGWAAQTPQGWWLDATGKAGVYISACGVNLCGRIEWLRAPLDKAGRAKTDIHNPSPALRSRPLCGLTILGGFVPDATGGWRGGWIYDPSTGNTYRSILHVAADGTLRVRGYVGVPLLGRSEIMTRPAQPLVSCGPG